jgi:hypothetical protein
LAQLHEQESVVTADLADIDMRTAMLAELRKTKLVERKELESQKELVFEGMSLSDAFKLG